MCDVSPLLGLGVLQNLRHIRSDAAGPLHEHEVGHLLESLEVDLRPAVQLVAVRDGFKELFAVFLQNLHLRAGDATVRRADEGAASQDAPVQHADLQLVVLVVPEERVVDLQVVVREAHIVVRILRPGAHDKGAELHGIVHEVQGLLLPLFQPLLVCHLLGEGALGRFAQKPDEGVDLVHRLLLRHGVQTGPPLGNLADRWGHREHLVDLGMQPPGLVVGRDLPQGLATSLVVHWPAVWQLPIHVFVIRGLDVAGFEVLGSLWGPIERLGDQDEVRRLCADVREVTLGHPVGDVLLQPNVEDRLRPVVVPHA
mmetsp:Transcript_1256/g.3786  ORF Transcript_1256/g.3786 Transcript_1256/m.3786 type:complete len:312 (+) Transcript_1256:219-1154(+)